MKVRLWGTRGSIAKPGADTLRYGGNTSCVQVESASGTLIVIDCGTGVHGLGQLLMRERSKPVCGHILISHTHWDHIQGIPFFAPLFVEGNEWDFYAAQGFGESLRDTLAGQMEYTYFPITLEALNATVRYHHLGEGSLQIGDIVVRTRYLNHPALTLGFRLEVDGASVVYACDHEPHSRELAESGGELTGEDLEHAEFMRGADLVIHDAQYTAAEYKDKIGWGHSTVQYATRLCQAVGVKRLALTHHDPLRNDDAVDCIITDLREELGLNGQGLEVFAAAEGQIFDLTGTATPALEAEPDSALRAAEQFIESKVLLVCADPARIQLLREGLAADGMEVWVAADSGAALATLAAQRPSLVLVDAAIDDGAGLTIAAAIRKLPDPDLAELPLVMIGDRRSVDAGAAERVTDWLLPPFSKEYARTRVRAWLMRSQCRWVKPPIPADEMARLEALRALSLLDTPREERFDRFTRLASSLLGTPFALITLVDADRQWFKSCFGFEAEETGREVSFCAHAINGRELFVVPDTLLDDRFADNPLVADDPRVRFYAGCPLHLPNGACVGTLCIVDQRPRELSAEQAGMLRDLGAMVEQELLRSVG